MSFLSLCARALSDCVGVRRDWTTRIAPAIYKGQVGGTVEALTLDRREGTMSVNVPLPFVSYTAHNRALFCCAFSLSPLVLVVERHVPASAG
jgi:hypothetical protein